MYLDDGLLMGICDACRLAKGRERRRANNDVNSVYERLMLFKTRRVKCRRSEFIFIVSRLLMDEKFFENKWKFIENA